MLIAKGQRSNRTWVHKRTKLRISQDTIDGLLFGAMFVAMLYLLPALYYMYGGK